MERDFNHPKVLVISDASWTNENNIGNTFSNIFGSWPSDKIATIYTRMDIPKNDVCLKHFQIAENRLIKNLFNKQIRTGKEIITTDETRVGNEEIINDQMTGKRMYGFFGKYRLNLFLTARNLLWRISNWRSIELNEFIDGFDPDVLFFLGCSESYMNNLQRYVMKYTKKKAAIYFVDDIYSLKTFSFSPLFWINRFFSRNSIRLTVEKCDIVYTISPDQQSEYDVYFDKKSKLLNKGGAFDLPNVEKRHVDSPLRIVYTGNIVAGRWKTIIKLAEALDELNSYEKKAVIYIYSHNKLDKKMRLAFERVESISFMGGVPSSEIKSIQEGADILLHVESFDLKEKLLTRLSLSTKIIDYFERQRCIIAIGWSKAASITYLKDNDTAIVIDTLSNAKSILSKIINDPELMYRYAQKSYSFGKANHKADLKREELLSDLIEIS